MATNDLTVWRCDRCSRFVNVVFAGYSVRGEAPKGWTRVEQRRGKCIQADLCETCSKEFSDFMLPAKKSGARERG